MDLALLYKRIQAIYTTAIEDPAQLGLPLEEPVPPDVDD